MLNASIDSIHIVDIIRPITAVELLEDLNARRQKLDENGVTVDTECNRCESQIEAEILPGESPEGTVCRDCIKDELREAELL